MKNETIKSDLKLFYDQWHAYQHVQDDYARRKGVSSSTIDVLAILQTIPEHCTQRFLVAHTLLPKQTINAVITSLLKQGYVDLTQSQSDRRVKEIRLTEAGRHYASEMIDPLFASDYQTMSEMPEDERTLMLKSLAAYTQAFADRVDQLN